MHTGAKTEIDFPSGSFTAIISFFAIIHVPLEEQPGYFLRFTFGLKSDGSVMVTVGSKSWTGTEEDWR